MVNGRLRCLGSSQHLKLRFGDGFEVNIKTSIPSEENLAALSLPLIQAGSLQVPPGQSNLTLTQMDGTKLTKVQLPGLLSGLGIHCPAVPGTAAVTLPQELSDLADAEMDSLPLRMLLEWAFAEKAAEELHGFLFELSGSGVGPGFSWLLERSSAHSFRYRMQVSSTSGGESPLAHIFRSFEAQKQRLFVQEYSVGQTTLEQIFNQFAASQDNPEVTLAALGNSGDAQSSTTTAGRIDVKRNFYPA